MHQYCPTCECEQEILLVQKEETYPVKGESTTINAIVCTCAHCGEEIMSFEYDDDNLRKAYAKYRSRHGLLQPEEIKAIREQYGVSQVTFARIIGVGDKTIARYENGSLQDEAINNLIVLARDPKNFSILLDKNKYLIAPEEVKRLAETLGLVRVFAVWSNTQSDYTYSCSNETEYLKYA